MKKAIAERIWEFMEGEPKNTREIIQAFPDLNPDSIHGRLHENIGKRFEKIGIGVYRPLTIEERNMIQNDKIHFKKKNDYSTKEIINKKDDKLTKNDNQIINFQNKEVLETLKLIQSLLNNLVKQIETQKILTK